MSSGNSKTSFWFFFFLFLFLNKCGHFSTCSDCKAPLSFRSCTHFSRSYIRVIDICILRQLSKTTSLAQGTRISLKCKWSLKKAGSDLRVSDIHTLVLSQWKCWVQGARSVCFSLTPLPPHHCLCSVYPNLSISRLKRGYTNTHVCAHSAKLDINSNEHL